MVHKRDAGKFMVNLVVEIAGDPSTRIEDSDRWFRHPARTGQLPDQREEHMRRRVQAFDRAMVRSVVQVGLDGDLLSSLVSRVAAIMRAIEVVKDGVPSLGIAFLICKAADGTGNHAVNYRLVVVGIGPPRTCAIPGHGRRIMRPRDSAGNHAASNSQWGKG